LSRDEDELVAPPPGGRVFAHPVVAGLADAAPSGRARLDAIARWLQDAALADVVDSGLDDGGVWVLRRMRLRVARFPRFGAALRVETFCSGTGPLIAERRSTVRGDGGDALVEAVALWVHLDAGGGRPRPLPDGFEAVYGAAAAGRRVRGRLRHPAAPPSGDLPERPWRFRAADLDLAGHVNNAVYWQVAEEEIVGGAEPAAPSPSGLPHRARDTVVGGPRWGLDAEIEHRAAGDVGPAVVVADGPMRWVRAAGGEVLATLRLG
jgi:acyl-ACP thioesterase